RLRLVVLDQGAVDEARLKGLGARGLVRPSPRDLQVVLGPQADQVAGEIRAALGALVGATVPSAPASAGEDGLTDDGRAPAVLAALGGAANVSEVSAASSRLRVTLKDAGVVDEAALRGLGARAFARPAAGVLHVILGSAAESLAHGLRPLIA
ncbi:MAG: N-acetyl-D-glucosamine transporter, partial [Phenylobacterium sp.]|nr:N-acetyl-D-glucosamine transporter [Phenylobacterium sp.]